MTIHWIVWAVPVLIIGLWFYTAQLITAFPTLRGKRIVFLIAHPDDEAMFFAPSLLALTRPDRGNHVKILCLSSGKLSDTKHGKSSRILTVHDCR